MKSLAPIDGMAVDRDGPHFPQRLASVVGFVRAERIPRRRPLVLAPPTLKATSLIRIVAMTWATIAVSHAGRVRPLRLVFPGGYAGSTDWIEVRVSKSRIAVGTILDPPIELTHLEDLAVAIANVRAVQGGDTRQPVDVLVESDVDTQRLVDVLVALDVAGERMIGIGSIGPHDLALRGRRIPNTSVAYRGGYGDIRYGDIWETVRGNQAKVNRCYDEALVHDRNLSGVMTLTLFVESNRVTAAEATGVDPELAHCVAAAFRTLAVTTSPTNGSRSRRGHHTFEITFRI